MFLSITYRVYLDFGGLEKKPFTLSTLWVHHLLVTENNLIKNNPNVAPFCFHAYLLCALSFNLESTVTTAKYIKLEEEKVGVVISKLKLSSCNH
jgi:hypothetical protein